MFGTSLLPGAAHLRLDEEGFTMCNLFRKGRLRWREVRDFRPYSVPGGTFVGFDLTDGTFPLGRFAARSLSGVEGGLPDTYGLDPEELAAVLNAWRDRYAT
jgi:Bacterial PH domain